MSSLPVTPYGRVATHILYDTVGHQHCHPDAEDGVPDLLIIECRDGRWYLEGSDSWLDCQEVCLMSDAKTFRPPVFFSSEESVCQRAVALYARKFNLTLYLP